MMPGLLPENWNMSSFDDTCWQQARILSGPGGQLRASVFPAMGAIASFKPRKIDEPEPGYFVYDFGQNISAKPRLTVRGKAGQVVRLTPSEQRFGQTGVTNDGKGRVNQAGVGKPNYWEYTLKGGGEEVWSPQFTYSGFQYLEVSGAVPVGQANPNDLPVVVDLVSLQVRNRVEQAGVFRCSDQRINDINRLIDWAVQSNLGHVLTDCPHREKLGWLEVSYLMGPSISWNYDIAAFYTKIIQDIKDSQDADGCIYTVAPNYPNFSGGFRYSPEWGAAGVFLPWHLYQWYGDRRILEQSYDMMKRYVDYMANTADDLIARPGLGDWYDYGHDQPLGASRFTPTTLTASATFYGCCKIVADTAEIIGKQDDQQVYRALSKKIKAAFNRTFYQGDGNYQNQGSPQTANAMALVLGLTSSETESLVMDRILEDLRVRGNQQTAGDIGYHYLVEALRRYGQSEALYRILDRTDLGSYGYIINQGWTSMPEAWNAHLASSMNHCMLGHIQQWFYDGLGGITPEKPGFESFRIQPEFVGDIDQCSCEYMSLYGKIICQWQKAGQQLELFVTVPVNTTATLVLPSLPETVLVEGGRAIDQAPGIHSIDKKRLKQELVLGSGQYCFELHPSQSP